MCEGSTHSAKIFQHQAVNGLTRKRADERDDSSSVAGGQQKRETKLVLCGQFGNVLNGRVAPSSDMHSQNSRIDICLSHAFGYHLFGEPFPAEPLGDKNREDSPVMAVSLEEDMPDKLSVLG
jgi:hypothetical protein